MSIKIKEAFGTKIINTTPHSLTFGVEGRQETISVPPCGIVLNGKAVSKICREQNYGDNRIEFVKTQFKKTKEGEEFLRGLPEGVIVVGSIIAAQAYPGEVCALVPVTGFERVPSDKKRMRHDKFTVF